MAVAMCLHFISAPVVVVVVVLRPKLAREQQSIIRVRSLCPNG